MINISTLFGFDRIRFGHNDWDRVRTFCHCAIMATGHRGCFSQNKILFWIFSQQEDIVNFGADLEQLTINVTMRVGWRVRGYVRPILLSNYKEAVRSQWEDHYTTVCPPCTPPPPGLRRTPRPPSRRSRSSGTTPVTRTWPSSWSTVVFATQMFTLPAMRWVNISISEKLRAL